MKCSLSNLLLVVTLLAVFIGWWLDRRQLAATVDGQEKSIMFLANQARVANRRLEALEQIPPPPLLFPVNVEMGMQMDAQEGIHRRLHPQIREMIRPDGQ